MSQFESDPVGPTSIDHSHYNYIDSSVEPIREPSTNEGADTRCPPGSENEYYTLPTTSPIYSAMDDPTQECPEEYDDYDAEQNAICSEDRDILPRGKSLPREIVRSDHQLSHDSPSYTTIAPSAKKLLESHDSSQAVKANGDHLPLDLSDEDATNRGSSYKSFTSGVDKVLRPTGSFIEYKARCNQEVPLNRSSRGGSANRLDNKYLAVLTLVLSFVAIASFVFVVILANGGKRRETDLSGHPIDHEVLDFAQIAAAANGTPLSYNQEQRTHPKKEHTHQLHIEPEAVATISKAHPDDHRSGLQELAVERDQRVSFLRFAIASNIEKDDNAVRKATLNLYLKAHSGGESTNIALAIKELPSAGEWIDQSLYRNNLFQKRISWNNPPDATAAYLVNILDISGLQEGATKKLIEVDVTEAILCQTTQEFITFELVAESDGGLWFASKLWKAGEAEPELVITLDNDKIVL